MAKKATGGAAASVKVSRPGVHAKTKTSKLKGSKLYKKLYKGQGKQKKKGRTVMALPYLF